MHTLISIIILLIPLTLGGRNGYSDLNHEWEMYKTTYNKNYDTEEEKHRRTTWEENIAYIERHNLLADRGLHTFWLGMNEYGDMTSNEFNKHMHGYRKSDEIENVAELLFKPPTNLGDLPKEIDWRDKGYVTGVGNQLQCGSCWAFTATGSLEGMHAKKTGELISLSEQNLMDCSNKEGNHGCEGGLMTQSYVYIKKNNGIDTEKSYPYTGKNGAKCLFNRTNVGATDTGYVNIKKDSEKDLQVAVATMGPIGNAIDGTQQTFQLYKSGVYSDTKCSKTQINHSLLIVGYGVDEKGQEYWTCKNSWGTTWGNQGYILIARNKNNMCGVASTCSYPTV